MIDDALGEEQQQPLAEVDILKELPEREVDHVAARSPICFLTLLAQFPGLDSLLYVICKKAKWLESSSTHSGA